MSDNRILFSDKNYRLLMTGQTVSTLGNSVSSFAFFAYTLALTQSPFYAALVSGCVTLAIVVMGVPAGIWADKHRPLPLMLSSTILGGAGICVVVANHFILHAPIPLVLAVAACLVGSATAVCSPAEKAALKTLVSPEHLGQAMAINQTRYSLGTVAGPIFGAFLHSLRPIATFVFDLCTYVFAFCTFRKLQVPDTHSDAAENDVQAGYRETLKILRADTVLWAVLWFTPILNFSMSSIFNSAFTQLAGAENGAYVLGVFQTYCGIMGLIGSTAATVLVSRVRGGVGLVATAVGFILAFGGLALVFTTVSCFVFLGLFWLLLPLFNSILSGYFLARIPQRFIGKASAMTTIAAMGFMPAGTWVSGFISERYDPPTVVVATVLLFLPATLAFVGHGDIRRLSTRVPGDGKHHHRKPIEHNLNEGVTRRHPPAGSEAPAPPATGIPELCGPPPPGRPPSRTPTRGPGRSRKYPTKDTGPE